MFDLATNVLWLLLAATGIALRTRRLLRLRRIALVTPVDPDDAAYLASVKRSTLLRMATKTVFLIGALSALFDVLWLWPLWRIGIVVVLALMVAETISVDSIRDRLGRVAPEVG